MARRAANRATNVNAVLLSCERSKILFSLDQQGRQQRQSTLMPKKKESARANDDNNEVYEVEDIRDDRLDPKVSKCTTQREICVIHIDSVIIRYVYQIHS